MRSGSSFETQTASAPQDEGSGSKTGMAATSAAMTRARMTVEGMETDALTPLTLHYLGVLKLLSEPGAPGFGVSEPRPLAVGIDRNDASSPHMAGRYWRMFKAKSPKANAAV